MKINSRGKRSKEPENLRRFKASMEEFTEQHDSDWAKIHGIGDGGVQKSKGKPRKQMRKEARKLKKMRKSAFKEHKQLPTAESIAKEKEEKAKEERNRKSKEKKRKGERERRKRKKLAKAESKEYVEKEDEVRTIGLREANKVEDKAIRQLEKQLKLNKRKKKSKSLPQCFVNDGLDFILDVVDEEKLKAMYDDEEELKPKAWVSDGSSGDESMDNEVDDMELSGDDSLENGSDNSSEIDMVDDDQSEASDMDAPQEKGVTKKSSRQKQTDSTSEKQKNKKLTNKPKKTVTFDTGASKVAKLDKGKPGHGKEQSAKSDKRQNVSNDDEDMNDTEGDNEDGVDDDGQDVARDSSDNSDSEGSVIDSGEENARSDEESSASDSDQANIEEVTDSQTKLELKEDIYGRLRDTAGQVVDSVQSGGYIPPAKRLLMAKSVDEKKKLQLDRMKKQLQGLINRLSESNMQSISSRIEEMFREHSRAELSEALTAIMISSCVAVSIIPDRLIMEHAMMMAVLHHNVGSEIGAQLVQTLGRKFDELIKSGSNYGEGKELDNLLIVFSHLLNFKILHSLLIFDIMKKLTDSFGERDIELILLVLKSVGFTLRKEDPVKLKELIISVQSKASTIDTSSFEDKSRVKFMLEVILAIKNNNMRKIPNYDPEHLEHMKKMIRNYVKGSNGGDTQLRISLEDLLKAEEKGRWWLVGSAWAGRDMDPQEPDKTATTKILSGVSSKVLEMARKQRMNTDVRKTIFCILMTSEDYFDAFEKLLRLGLKHQQEKEIIHVILDVSLQEKAPNPFYAYLCHKFCELDRRFMMTTQFSVWDRFSEVDQLGEQQITNLAALLVHLVANKALSLSVFKKVEFAELDKSTVRLMKLVLTGLLTDFPDHITTEVFSRIAHLHKLHSLKDGLRLFMQHFLLRNKGKSAVTNETLKERVQLAEKALTSAEGTSKL